MNALSLPAQMASLVARTKRPMSRDKADTLLLLVSCTLVLLPHFGHLPGWIIPACIALLLWRGWITFNGLRMPPRWLLLPVAALTMAGVYLSHRTLVGQDAGVSMLVLLLTLKLLEMHAKRDLFVVLFLSFFLILASFFYSQSIGTAFMTVIAVIAILTTQVSFQYTGMVPPLKKRIGLATFIFGLSIPLTLVLFLLFPRIQGPLWSMPSDAGGGRTGLSDTMSPGNISKLAQSEEIAFRAKFIDQPPAKADLYWRGPVLGMYDGRTWTPVPPTRRSTQSVKLNTHGEPIRYQVTLEPHGRHWLFALEMPQSLPELSGNNAIATPEVELLSAQPITDRIRYDAASYINYKLQPEADALALTPWLTLPAGFNPRTLEFAAQLRRQSNTNLDVINAALRFFREEQFRYTLEPPALSGRHVADEFLFSTKAGFCEHYASAFVILMRAAGIPARVVTGYQGGEINTTDGFMTVRQSDAHAWAEVWLAKRGWVRIDPTAAVSPNRIEANLGSAVPRSILGGLVTFTPGSDSVLAKIYQLRMRWEAINNVWNQWVLNYTPEKQKGFLESLGLKDVNWRTLVTLMFVFGILAMTIVVLPLLLQRRKKDPMEAIYEALCKRMAQYGIDKARHEGPRAYAARLTAPDSPLPLEKKAAAANFLTLYEAMRYGSANNLSTAASLAKLKSLLAECR